MIQGVRDSLKNRTVIFPIVWKSVLKLASAAILTILWNILINKSGYVNPLSHVLPVIGFVYLFMTWLGFLRLDGVHMPRVFSYKKSERKTKTGTSMHDYADTEPENDEELTQKERDVCAFLSWGAAGVICLIVGGVSFII